MIHQRWVRYIAIASILLLVGFGCRGLSKDEQAAIRPVTLNYWTVFDDVELLEAWAQEYRQLRPYVTINIRQVRSDTFDDQFITALADGVGPDIVSMHVHNIGKHRHRLSPMPSSVQVANVEVKGTYAKETIVTQVTNAMPTRSTIDRQYVSAVLEDVSDGRNVYGLPLSIDTLALYYNRDILDRAGVAEPPVSWGDFVKAVEATTAYGGADTIVQSGVAMGTAGNIEHRFDVLSLLMFQNNVVVANDNTVTFANGVTRNADNHPSLNALKFYTDFARPTSRIYSWNEDMGSAFQAFVRGQSAFYIGFAFDRPRIEAQAPQLNYDVVEIPQLNPSDPSNVANYWIQTVVNNSSNKNEAWDFIRHITRSDKVAEYSEVTGQPSPYRVHVADQSEDELLGPFASQVLHARNWYHGKNFGAALVALDDLITAYKEPYPLDGEPAERDASLLLRASRIIQQTYE